MIIVLISMIMLILIATEPRRCLTIGKITVTATNAPLEMMTDDNDEGNDDKDNNNMVDVMASFSLHKSP